MKKVIVRDVRGGEETLLNSIEFSPTVGVRTNIFFNDDGSIEIRSDVGSLEVTFEDKKNAIVKFEQQ